MNKFTISDLSVDEINLIVVGLYELPGKYTLSLIPKIKEQIEKQGAKASPATQPIQQAPNQPPVGPLSNKVIG